MKGRSVAELPPKPKWEITAFSLADSGDRLFEHMSDVVLQDPEILGGEPVFKGTRVPVKSLFDHLEAGDSIEVFLDGFPSVRREQVIALLEESKAHAVARP
jgi:uncharacterized protein (DUF433 family)